MLLCFICSAVHWTERESDPCYHQEIQPISLLNLLSPLRGKGMGLLKGNVIIPAVSATLHISEAADRSPRRVVTLLTTSLMLSSFSRNLNNRPVPWVYWTWFVLQVGKQLWVSCLDELTCLHKHCWHSRNRIQYVSNIAWAAGKTTVELKGSA